MGRARAALATKIAAVAALALLSGPQAALARTYMTGSFDALVVRGDVAVEVVTGGAPGVSADGAPADIDRLRVERSGSRLTIRVAPAPQTRQRNAGPVRVRVSARALNRLDIQGAGVVGVDRMAARDAAVSLAGTGAVTIGDAAADRLRLSATGSGSVSIGTGRARNADIILTGAVRLDAPGFTADRLVLAIAGASDAAISVDEVARISGGGAGRVVITGAGNCIVTASASLGVTCPVK